MAYEGALLSLSTAEHLNAVRSVPFESPNLHGKLRNMVFIEGSLVRPKQIRVQELVTVERVLASRGFGVRSEHDGTESLLSKSIWTRPEAELMFQCFDEVSLRNELKSVVSGGMSPDSDLVHQLTCNPAFVSDRQRFDRSFEWYVGELLVRRFGAMSSSSGVEINDVVRASRKTTGDYDVLSVLGDFRLLYVECKTGGFSRPKLVSMIERTQAIGGVASVMLLANGVPQHGLRQMTEGLTFPLAVRSTPPRLVSTAGLSGSEVHQWHDAFFVSAASDVGKQLQTVLRLVGLKPAYLDWAMGIGMDDLKSLGFECRPA